MSLLLVLLLAIPQSHASNNQMVIQELRKLRDSLSSGDSQRRELSLRIADLLANQCLVSTNGLKPAAREKDCQEAFLTFSESVATAPKATQSKIRFQMARIALERKDTTRAKPLFEAVLQESHAPELKREAALRLAELAEASSAGPGSAVPYYEKALEFCNGSDACSFARYRMAWVHKKEGRLSQALTEMKLALMDSRGQPRQEAVRDLIQFMGQDPAPASTHIPFVEEFASRTSQPILLENLADAYFVSGNKVAGVETLEIVHSRNPTLPHTIRLLEENYGLRNWDRFSLHLNTLDTMSTSATPAPESIQICKRLALQLDGERTTNPARTADYIRFSTLTLRLFPSISDRTKLMEGVVAALATAEEKISQIHAWVQNISFQFVRAEKIQLHELAAGIAQGAKNTPVVIQEMNALLALAPTESKREEYEYARAKAQYDGKDYVSALTGFRKIAEGGMGRTTGPTTLAVQSQHLALDILNLQKDLAGLQAQAERWTKNSALSRDPKLARDMKEMAQIAEQAEFEGTVALGATPGALTAFRDHCVAGRFRPKSCENAKTLAIQLESHSDLVAILEASGDTENLMHELEAGGQFADAALLHEKTSPGPAGILGHELRSALLFELGGRPADRDRVLNRLLKTLAKNRVQPSEPEQLALASTVADAGILHSGWLRLPGFSTNYRNFVAERLEQMGRGSAESKKILTAALVSTGPTWDQLVWKEAMRLEEAESKIGFHTRDGQRQFQRRVDAMKKLGQYLERMIPGSPSELRVKLLRLSENSLARLAQEITQSPVPAGLTPDQLAEIQANLAEMARPFQERKEATAALIRGEIEKTTELSEKTRIQTLAQSEIADWMKAESTPTPAAPKSEIAQTMLLPHLSQLARNPKDVGALRSLETLYKQNQQFRLAKYYEGRIAQLQQEAK